MPRVKVKDFITIDIPDDMEYSDNLETQLFSVAKMGPIAQQMKEDGMEQTLEGPAYGADRCFVLHSTSFRELANDHGTDFSDSSIRGQVLNFIDICAREDVRLLVDNDDLIVAYEPCDEECCIYQFGIYVATPKYFCPGQLWLNDMDGPEERTNEAERWLKTIEPIRTK